MISNRVGCKIQILLPNLVAFISQKEKPVCFFNYLLLTCSVRKMVLTCLMQNIDMCLLYKSHQIARFVSHLIKYFFKWMFTLWQENATKFGTENKILHIFISLSDLLWLYFSGFMHNFI